VAKASARVCVSCWSRQAIFLHGQGRRATARGRKDHPICRQCYRALLNRMRHRPFRVC